MAKARRGSKENPATIKDVENALNSILEKPFIIVEGSIKDDFLDYIYEIRTGVGVGRLHKVNGKNSGLIIDDDLRSAFVSLHQHMACIDMAFKDSGQDVKDIDSMANDDLTFRYYATGFKMKGGEGEESIIIIGNKTVDMGYMPFESPKISLESSSSYKWYNELKAVADKLRLEVELYDGGKGTKTEEPEVDQSKQGKLFVKATGGEEFDEE